jgi:hypothetical protein
MSGPAPHALPKEEGAEPNQPGRGNEESLEGWLPASLVRCHAVATPERETAPPWEAASQFAV